MAGGGRDWRAWRLYGAIVVATLAATELAARVYDWSPRSRDAALEDNLGGARYGHSSSGYGDLVPAQNGHWTTWFHRPYHVQTNSAGLRNAEEVSDKAFRVLAVGDSQTFGPFLANEDTWPGWTENYLRQRDGSADRTQVLNAGISGYTIVDELAYLKDKAVALKPGLVVLAVFENDMYDLLKERNGTRRRPSSSVGSAFANIARSIGHNSALVRLAERAKTRMTFAANDIDYRQRVRGATGWAPPMSEDPELAKRYTAFFGDAVRLLRSHDINLAVIFIPSAESTSPQKPSTVEPIIRAATAETATPYLDLTAAFRTQPDPVTRLYLLQHSPSGELTGDGHLSREGNAFIGKTLATWLVDRELVPARKLLGSRH